MEKNRSRTEAIVNSILEGIRADLTDFVEAEDTITSSVTYEERILALSRQFSKDIISKSMGKMPKSRNLKKSTDEFRSS